MTLTEFKKKSQRTLPRLATVEDDIKHMLAGVITEYAEILDLYKKELAYKKEIDTGHLQEELGDLMFYLVGLHSIRVGKDAPIQDDVVASVSESMFPTGLMDNILFITSAMSSFIEHFTSVVPDALICEGVILIKKLGYDLGDILKKNVAKLEARYPDGFSEDKAINKDVNKEKQALSSAH